MIKTIKKIDIHGNEIWQEKIACDRCKRVLEDGECYHSWRRVKSERINPGPDMGFVAYGSTQNNTHYCDKCDEAIRDFLQGKDLKYKNPR